MTGIMDTSGKFAAGMDDKTHKNCWQNLPLVSLVQVANLPPVSLILSLNFLKNLKQP
jgi:hypothetical protein